MAQIKSKAPGIVKALKVKVGDTVKAGAVAVIMEAMKMEMPLACTADGVVTDIKFEEGARVGPGAVLIEIA
jgi:biotin carboxyl carrier protein